MRREAARRPSVRQKARAIRGVNYAAPAAATAALIWNMMRNLLEQVNRAESR